MLNLMNVDVRIIASLSTRIYDLTNALIMRKSTFSPAHRVDRHLNHTSHHSRAFGGLSVLYV